MQYNEARYGRSNGYPCAGNVCSQHLEPAAATPSTPWVAERDAAGQTAAQIKAELAEFDQWDRYDYDGDGNFNEPDGYIDHFQIVHSGGDQADGDPWQGEDAIWSHRWRAFQNSEQGSGPANFPIGGAQIGTTGLWVADYTIQPENGGLSVFAHEYGHDLGLPDLYDTEPAPTSPVAWWSLMAQSRLSAKNDEGIGERPGDLGAWEKLQLGWLDYEIAIGRRQAHLRARPARVQLEEGAGPGGGAAEEAGGDRPARPGRRRPDLVQRQRRRPGRQHGAVGDAAGGDGDAVVPGERTTSRTAARIRATTPTSR